MYGPMKGISPTLSNLVEYIMVFSVKYLVSQLLVLYIWLLFEQGGNTIKSVLPHIRQHFAELFLEIFVVVRIFIREKTGLGW